MLPDSPSRSLALLLRVRTAPIRCECELIMNQTLERTVTSHRTHGQTWTDNPETFFACACVLFPSLRIAAP